jgi:hypothetical protein
MMASRYTNDADYWRKQAAEMRELAQTASIPARENLLRLARDYDLLAQGAQLRPQGTPPHE